MAFQTPITIKEAISNVHSKKYLLPAIQREVVWDTDQIERLFDSLMRDYPIGSFLFWMVKRKQTGKYQFYEFVRDYHERDNPHNPKASISGEDDITGILDGQQRLTALYVGLKGPTCTQTQSFLGRRWKPNSGQVRLVMSVVLRLVDGRSCNKRLDRSLAGPTCTQTQSFLGRRWKPNSGQVRLVMSVVLRLVDGRSGSKRLDRSLADPICTQTQSFLGLCWKPNSGQVCLVMPAGRLPSNKRMRRPALGPLALSAYDFLFLYTLEWAQCKHRNWLVVNVNYPHFGPQVKAIVN